MYEIFYTSAAARQLRGLPHDVAARIRDAIEALATTPRAHQTEKLAGTPDAYRLRIGRYRMVYTIDDRNHRVVISRIAHRREVYR